MPVDDVLLDCEMHMEKAVDHLQHELRGLRTGRASPALVEDIRVDYYGSQTPLKSIASISIPEATQILIKPFSPADMKAIEKAFASNAKGKKVKGGSTISQQTAKNVFLWPGRSWIRKGFEAYFTFMIELIWGKKRILEVYLNVIEMGRGIYGIEAAAQSYFNKPAASLTRAEAATIASCLPNPKNYTVKPLSNYVASRRQTVLQQMNNLEEDPDLQDIISEQVTKKKK